MWSSCGFFISDDDVSRLKIVLLLEKNCFKNEVWICIVSNLKLTHSRQHYWANRSAADDDADLLNAAVTAAVESAVVVNDDGGAVERCYLMMKLMSGSSSDWVDCGYDLTADESLKNSKLVD